MNTNESKKLNKNIPLLNEKHDLESCYAVGKACYKIISLWDDELGKCAKELILDVALLANNLTDGMVNITLNRHICEEFENSKFLWKECLEEVNLKVKLGGDAWEKRLEKLIQEKRLPEMNADAKKELRESISTAVNNMDILLETRDRYFYKENNYRRR